MRYTTVYWKTLTLYRCKKNLEIKVVYYLTYTPLNRYIYDSEPTMHLDVKKCLSCSENQAPTTSITSS